MSDNFTETTSQGWLSRLGNAFKGILVGIVLVIAATILLFWNEGRTVKRAGAIDEAQSAYVDMGDISTVDASFDGKLVYATGMAKSDEILQDTVLNISQKGINLTRNVEVYQWIESSSSSTEKNTGGSTTTSTTYTYEKDWSSAPVNSSQFKKPEGHYNSVNYRIDNAEWTARNVFFGAYRLPQFLSSQVETNTPVTVELTPTAKMRLSTSAKRVMQDNGTYSMANPMEVVHVIGNQIYVGANSNNPNIGDVRITYTYTPDTDVSLIAKTQGNTFVEYRVKNGESYSAIAVGIQSAQSMFESDKSSNTFLAWFLRILGIILVCAGLNAILAPIVVIADVLPILGDIASVGTRLFTGIIGTAWSLLVIAFAWIYYRPMLAIALVAIVVGLIYLLVKKTKKAKAATAA